jgi:hypothetical protein
MVRITLSFSFIISDAVGCVSAARIDRSIKITIRKERRKGLPTTMQLWAGGLIEHLGS